jgi:hypothetical protein
MNFVSKISDILVEDGCAYMMFIFFSALVTILSIVEFRSDLAILVFPVMALSPLVFRTHPKNQAEKNDPEEKHTPKRALDRGEQELQILITLIKAGKAQIEQMGSEFGVLVFMLTCEDMKFRVRIFCDRLELRSEEEKLTHYIYNQEMTQDFMSLCEHVRPMYKLEQVLNETLKSDENLTT